MPPLQCVAQRQFRVLRIPGEELLVGVAVSILDLLVVVGVQELVGLKPRQIWKQGVGRTFQIAETFASLTVLENVRIALQRKLGKRPGRE